MSLQFAFSYAPILSIVIAPARPVWCKAEEEAKKKSLYTTHLRQTVNLSVCFMKQSLVGFFYPFYHSFLLYTAAQILPSLLVAIKTISTLHLLPTFFSLSDIQWMHGTRTMFPPIVFFDHVRLD